MDRIGLSPHDPQPRILPLNYTPRTCILTAFLFKLKSDSMKIIKSLDSNELVNSLKNGGVAVIPTDTVYGIVASALSEDAIEKIYGIKGREKNKPFIILISSLDDLKILDINLDEATKKTVEKYWPGKVSIVFPTSTGTLAARLPDYPKLLELIKKTGPLIAPSANPQGLIPAKNIQEAINYFGDKVDYYIDSGELDSSPSTLIKIQDGKVVVLREGAVTINNRDSKTS